MSASAQPILKRGDAKARKEEIHIEEMHVFGVRLKRSYENTFFLAHSDTAAPSLFYKRKEAVDYKRTLIKEGFKSAKVVPVYVRFDFPISTPLLRDSRAVKVTP